MVTTNGIKIVMSDLVEHLRHSRATAGLSSDIVFCRVRLADNAKWLYVVAFWLPGKDKPLILLTSMVVESIEQARRMTSNPSTKLTHNLLH